MQLGTALEDFHFVIKVPMCIYSCRFYRFPGQQPSGGSGPPPQGGAEDDGDDDLYN